MYGRKSPDRWNKRLQVASLFLFFIFATVSILGIYLVINGIGKITDGQQLMISKLTGNQTVQISPPPEPEVSGAYVSYKDFILHQRNVEKDIKSIKYELERLRATVSKRSNPL